MRLRVEIIVPLGIVVLILGFYLGSFRSNAPEQQDHADDAEAQIWTCSMHPQIQLAEPGQCPICRMDLIPVAQDDGVETSDTRLTMSEAAMRLAEIQTSPVERRFPSMELRMVGKVEFDESRMREISARVPGRLDRLYVDYTGIAIRKGDHLVSIYSPDLINAQEELLQAIRAQAELEKSGVRLLRETTRETVIAARDKLRLLGLTAGQIEGIEERGAVEDHVTIYAPIDGIVLAKHAVEGKYVSTGEPIYSIADLSQLWIKLDAYESDLAWLRYGQDLSFTAEAYPGREFSGKISFIDPVLDARTRTAKVRVNVDNADLTLKPEMFVRATVQVLVASTGHVMSEALAGKWVCPMHPEVVSDRAGDCNICGMDLVQAERLGYTAPDSEEPPLIIPATAPLITGRRAVVYVEVTDAGRPTFEGREVVLGSRAGDFYIVESGLHEGERVVVHGAFKIDSAMQIQAKPSMMTKGGGSAGSTHQHGTSEPPHSSMESPSDDGAFRSGLTELVLSAADLSARLASDDRDAASKAAGRMLENLGKVESAELDGPNREMWSEILQAMQTEVAAAAHADEISAIRERIPAITEALTQAVQHFGIDSGNELFRFHCPMAFGAKGADWFQVGKTTANPYYGASMLRCGSAVESLAGGDDGK